MCEEAIQVIYTNHSQLAGERVRPWMFGDNPQFEASDLPSVRTVRKIHRLARRFFKENLAESSWNNDVHSKRLEWVMRDSPSSDDDLLDYRCRYVLIPLQVSNNTNMNTA